MSGETILIIDDGQDNREFIIEYVIKPNQYQHLSAKDGEQGLLMAIKQRPDLILLDLQMPKLTGIQVLEQLHARNIAIPVILMTFHGSEDIAVEVYRMGVKDYIKKPYYPDEMLEAIDRALSETRLRREKDALTERILKANQTLQRRITEFETLYQVGKLVTSTADLTQLLPQIVDAAAHATDAQEAHIILLEEGQLVRWAHRAAQRERAQMNKRVVNDGITRHVIQTKTSVILDAERLRQGGKHPNAPYSIVCVPLRMNDHILGTLQVTNLDDAQPAFNKNDARLLQALSDYAAIAIQNARHLA